MLFVVLDCLKSAHDGHPLSVALALKPQECSVLSGS